MERDAHPLVSFAAVVLGLLWMAWLAWCTVVAFVGGRLPVPFVELRLSGGVGLGLLWLLVVDPILATVGWWLSAPILALLSSLFPPEE